ncbi:MAG: putative lipase [Conexibacter sp.]|nr:putative lipase [Conexibacter sp.]
MPVTERVWTKGADGNDKTDFGPGDEILYVAQINNVGTAPFNAALSFRAWELGNPSVVVYGGTQDVTLAPGSSTYSAKGSVPKDAKPGSYIAFARVVTPKDPNPTARPRHTEIAIFHVTAPKPKPNPGKPKPNPGKPKPGEPKPTPGEPKPTPPPNYVALGDSFSAGEGVEGFEPKTWMPSNQCHRSDRAYPVLLSQDVPGLTPFVSRACSGAYTDDLWATGHKWPEPAQLEAGGGSTWDNTKVVTITIGGNDVGFPQVMTSCVLGLNPTTILQAITGQAPTCRPLLEEASGRIDALGGTAKDKKTPDGQKIHSIEDVIRGIHDKAKKATIYVGTYPKLFTTEEIQGCLIRPQYIPGAFFWYLDGHFMKSANRRIEQTNTAILNAVDQVQADKIDVKPVNVSLKFAGHELCTLGSWINTIDPKNQAYSFHPNADGQRCGYEAAFLEAMSRPAPPDCAAKAASAPRVLSRDAIAPAVERDAATAAQRLERTGMRALARAGRLRAVAHGLTRGIWTLALRAGITNPRGARAEPLAQIRVKFRGHGARTVTAPLRTAARRLFRQAPRAQRVKLIIRFTRPDLRPNRERVVIAERTLALRP